MGLWSYEAAALSKADVEVLVGQFASTDWLQDRRDAVTEPA
jgi:hypothetical protein